MKTGDRLHGYIVKSIEPIEQIDSVIYKLEHEPTGAVHIHIKNNDRENTFGVMFRTVPEDSTGVAHILEHTVLCGSEKFDVRDPFFSMLKRGLSSFMNALTSSDWTMYPFATSNRKDYYNLMDVYLDAAFFPKLDELSFKQEGHRLDIHESGDEMDLVYKGVVYNEMKGAMSSPREVMGRSLLKALYPDTTYCCNSGGEPSEIPTLKHQDLISFHSKYYHPSNAFFYTYGSFDLEDHLKFINGKVLSRFGYKEMDTSVRPQPRWSKPREATFHYPLSGDEDPAKKYQACVAWLGTDIRDSFEIMVLTVLEEVLLGNASSPLRKALIDSGLGSALSDTCGFDADLRDTMFSCGLKEISEDSIRPMEELIFNTLEKLASKGIDKRSVKSAVHQIEFYRKEKTNTPYPYGIKLLLTFSSPWIHQGDPVDCINFDKDLEKLKELVEDGGFLESKIREYFIDNPHRVLFTLAPDQAMEKREAEREKQELADILKRLDSKEIEKIRQDAKALAELQEKEEDTACLPTLELNDVPPQVETIQPDTFKGAELSTFYKKSTSGIIYFTCPAGTGSIEKELLSLVPFFCTAFTGSGTRKRDYAEMAELMDLYTGGVAIAPHAGKKFSDNGDCMAFLTFQGKALCENVDPMFDIMGELVLERDFSDHTRLKNLLYQYRAQLESSIVGNGHRYAIFLAARRLSPVSHMSEIWNGISQYKFIKDLVERIEKGSYSFEALEKDLEKIAAAVFTKGNLKPAAVGDEDAIRRADQRIASIEKNLDPAQTDLFELQDLAIDSEMPYEGWSTNTSVSFVGQAFHTVRLTHEDAPALAVISKLLRSLYLHKEIREKGGAYGGFALYNTEEGIFSFGSYRDPNITRTIEVYAKACDYIKSGDYSDDDIKEAVLQVCADIDRPETEGPASLKAYYRLLMNLSDDKRQAFKASLLAITREHIKRAAHRYFDISDAEKGTAVISSKTMLENENASLSDGRKPLELHRI
ncbi:MAG: insulinase family protein [Desulfobacteraceae bacterium]